MCCGVRFNNHLRKRSYPLIENPTNDFETGVRLMQVVNALYDVPIPKHNANPKLRAQKLDNVELAFKMVEAAKIKTNFLKHAHLVDKDTKMILGMMASEHTDTPAARLPRRSNSQSKRSR